MPIQPGLIPTLVIFTLALTGCTQAPSPDPSLEQEQVTVSGLGEVRASPTIFHLRGASRREGEDIRAMHRAVDQDIRAALALADNLGLPRESVQATQVELQPVWQWQPEQKLVGHRLTRDVHFRVEGLERYGALLSGLTDIGFTQLHPAGQGLADTQSLRDQALGQALSDARRKAQVLAQEAERSLGRALRIEEEITHSPSPHAMLRTASESQEESAYRAGEMTLEARVRVVFALE
ncbi:MAG: SIMPL domain-containing protein [Oleiphilaceae bacterium]|nr:SIMPL domain-containing protein [Oleiphilaceae bacterium]